LFKALLIGERTGWSGCGHGLVVWAVVTTATVAGGSTETVSGAVLAAQARLTVTLVLTSCRDIYMVFVKEFNKSCLRK